MKKKTFRPQREARDRACYPAYGDEGGRREFLRELGLVLAGGAMIAAFPECNSVDGGISGPPTPLDKGVDALDASPEASIGWPDMPKPEMPLPDAPLAGPDILSGIPDMPTPDFPPPSDGEPG